MPRKLLRLNRQDLKYRICRNILLLVIIPIIILRLGGFLKPLEWTNYDFLFSLRPEESQEENIVLVVWNETDLQLNEESTISDATLAFVLDTVRQQQPRVIGLDLFRDIPVPSFNQSKQENKEAYRRLNEIFQTTPNLIGIEKSLDPKINPPSSLKEAGRVTAADLIPDKDNIVRRAFISTQPITPTGEVTSAPYLGLVLGYQYLAQDNWQSSNGDKWGSFAMAKGREKVLLKQLKSFDGPYINNHDGLDFLINWRKNKNPFITVSVADLISGTISDDLFTDKIVLIGNTAASTADRHVTPLQRWNETEPWTYGVDIPAQVASSLINAALNNRPLMAIAPGGLSYWLLVICSLIIALGGNQIRHFPRRKISFYLISINLVISLVLFLISFSLFLNGYFLPIILPLLGILGSALFTFNEIQFNKERNNILKLKSISRSLSHELNNSINLIQLRSNETSQCLESANDLAQECYTEVEELGYYETPFNESKLGQSMTKIRLKLEDQNTQVESLKHELKRTNGYVQFVGSNKVEYQTTNINSRISKITNTIIAARQETTILVEEKYDPLLQKVKINSLALEIIITNLVNNALDAIIANNLNQGILLIKTTKKHNSVEITVKDNGIGIPAHLQNKIFEPFVSYKSKRSQGIGLAIVKEFLDIENGKICLISRLEEGATFILTLPFH